MPDPQSTSPDSGPKSFAVSRYLESIKRLVTTKVPPVWVHGVISQYSERDRWCFLSLSEYAPGDVRPLATLNLFLFRADLDALHARLDRLPRPFRLGPELKVSLLVEADFHVPQGKFQARVADIDPRHTLGEMAMTRQAILQRLSSEQLLDRNRRLPAPELPLRIGLITAQGSAASRDFIQTLRASGFAFRLTPRWTRMQGNGMEHDILEALGALRLQEDLDVVCIVRGGGSRNDLNYFDSEALCRAVALFPRPVLTGIGHEIDNALLDLVGYRACITPTDCAKFLAETAAAAWEASRSLAGTIARSVSLQVESQRTRLLGAGATLRHALPRRLARERQLHALYLRGLSRGPAKLLALHHSRFSSAAQRLGLLWKYRRDAQMRSLEQRGANLKRAWTVRVRQERVRQEHLQQLRGARDPLRLLQRGYALVWREDGTLLKRWADLRAAEGVQVQLADGTRPLKPSQ